MDYNHVSHAAAWAWQRSEDIMDENTRRVNYLNPPPPAPVPLPDQPLPQRPLFFNNPTNTLNLRFIPGPNQVPHYQKLNPGEYQTSAQVEQYQMQTPMAANTGVFMPDPMPVQQFTQSPMAMEFSHSAASASNTQPPAMPPLEDVFDPSRLLRPELEQLTPFPGSLGDIPPTPNPEESLFMQFMASSENMRQQIAQPSRPPNWTQPNTPLPSQFQMQMAQASTPPMQTLTMQRLQTPQISQIQLPQMQVSPMHTPQTQQFQMPQVGNIQVPQLPSQMPQMDVQQMQMSPMQAPQTPSTPNLSQMQTLVVPQTPSMQVSDIEMSQMSQFQISPMQMPDIQPPQTPQALQIDVQSMQTDAASVQLPPSPQLPQMQTPQMNTLQMPYPQPPAVQTPQPFQIPQAETPSMHTIQTPSIQIQNPQIHPLQWQNPGQIQPQPSQDPSHTSTPSNTHRVRFQGLPDLNSPTNPLTPNNGSSKPSTPQIPHPTLTPHRPPPPRPPTQNTRPNGPFAPFPQVPKTVVQISEEPWSRSFPPIRPAERLKQATDPPFAGRYAPGKMKVSDHQEYRSNLVYLGKPTAKAKERIPAPLKLLGSVPEFQGDASDLNAVREYLNVLTDWTNQYVRTACNSITRYDTHLENISKRLKEMAVEKRYITEAVKEVYSDENTPIPELLRTRQNDIAKLEGTIDLLNHHHRNCSQVRGDIESFTGLSVQDKTAVQLQKEISDRRMRELESVNGMLKLKNEVLETTKLELRQAKDLITVYQVQIQEMVNKDNFQNVAKLQVIQRLFDTQNAAHKLEERYKALFEKAKELSRECQSLKTMMGWMEELPEDVTSEEHEQRMNEDLAYRYQILFENTKCAVAENAKMKEQLKAEKSIMELQAEYEALKKEMGKLEDSVGGTKALREQVERGKNISQQLGKQREAWKAEVEGLKRNNDRYGAIISAFKEEKDKLEAKYNAAAREIESRKGLEGESKAMKESLDKLQARYEELKRKHEGAKEYILKREEEVKQMKERYVARKEEVRKATSEKDSVMQQAMGLKSEYDKVVEEKQQLEAKTTQLMELHKGALGQNETLTKKYLARKLELEGLKRRLEKNGPAKIYRMRLGEKDGGVGQEECAMTMAEVMHSLGQPGLRAQLVAFLKQTGDIKE